MKLLYSLPVATYAGVVAAEMSRRGMATDGADFASKTYDYIVIGGGTAGLTLAARLSENPKVSVGVIEAGVFLPEDPILNTPASALTIAGNPTYDWMFQSVPQVYANNQPINLPRGKVLGGSSAINAMIFNRGSKAEYDAWAKLGNPGWDWDGLLPNMKAAERFTGVDPFRVNYTGADPDDIFPSQGKNGVVAADYNNWYPDLVLPVQKSMAKLGVPVNFDPDSGNAVGLYNTATSINRTTGRRSYSATTYYAYNAQRPNFVVLTGAQATKINFKDTTGSTEPENLVATGVSFVHNSQTYKVKASKEVILSAGTYQSPQLLELSGIGNSTILGKHGIKTLIDLPSVGENYQEHFLVGTAYELKPGSSSENYDVLRNNATYAAAAAAQYNATHDGILSSIASILSFISPDRIANSAEIAKMTAKANQELASKDLTPIQRASYKIQKEWLKEKIALIELVPFPGYGGIGALKPNTSYITYYSVVQHPFSRGSIHINSSDPLAPPQIDPKYFSKSIGKLIAQTLQFRILLGLLTRQFFGAFSSEDLDILVHSVKFADKLSKTEPLASIIASRLEPGPNVTSDAAIAEYIKAGLSSIHHPIGSISLAPKELGGVVDVNLKVYGTANVRVVDASIIPLHIGAHTQRTVYGIAEKAAKNVKQGH